MGGGGPVETGHNLAKIFEVMKTVFDTGVWRLNYAVKRALSFSFILSCALLYLDIDVCSNGLEFMGCNVSCYIAS